MKLGIILYSYLTFFYILQCNISKIIQIRLIKWISLKIWIECHTTPVILKIIWPSSGDIWRHLPDIIFGMHSTHDRRAELIVFSGIHNERDTLLIFFWIDWYSYEWWISFPSMLDIHREIIHKIFFDESSYYIRILTIGIEFHRESSRLDRPTKIWEISVDRRFSSTDRDSIENSYSSIEKIIEYFLRDMHRLIRYDLIWYYHLRIVTIPTPEIASSGEYHSCNMTWVVDEGALLESWNYHDWEKDKLIVCHFERIFLFFQKISEKSSIYCSQRTPYNEDFSLFHYVS